MAERTDARPFDVPGDDPRGEELAEADLLEPQSYRISPDETEAEELQSEGDASVVVDDPQQLGEAEALAARVRSSRPQRRTAQPVQKDALTPTRRSGSRSLATDAEKRATPAEFVRQSADELKKVVWPTGRQVQQYFAVVLVFVLFIMAYVVGLDTGFGWILLKLFG